jgi:hypothetical protein
MSGLLDSKDKPEVDNNYNYYKYIYTPTEMGVSVGSDMNNVSDGVAAIFKYIKVLVEGKSGASKTGKPLGNKFFVETSEKCIERRNKKEQIRSIYFDNIPTGNFGVIKDTGENFSEFRGLIPGLIENMMGVAKIDFFSVFTESKMPNCDLVRLKTVDINNKKGEAEAYVTVDDIKQISPCNFVPTGINTETRDTCKREDFMLQNHMKDEEIDNANLYENYYKLGKDKRDSESDSDSDSNSDDENDNNKKKNKNNNNKKKNKNNNMKLKMPDDLFLQILFYSLGALSVYIALKLLANMYKKRD